jgi:mono/diheme cytochrome c family protein
VIYCVVCHDPLGTGYGKIVERGYTRPPSYHIPRLREAPVGRLFAVVSEGYGSMPSYAGQIPIEDRWAIIAYLRALQLSQHFPEAELTDEMRAKFAAAEPKVEPAAIARVAPP